MEDALWRRLLAGLLGWVSSLVGVWLGAFLGLGLAETALSGSNGFATPIDGWESHRFEHPVHALGLVLGMAIPGAVTLHLVVPPLIRLTGLVGERTLQRMISRRGR